MSEALLFFTVSSLLIVSVVTLVVAGRALRSARRYVELAERRMEHVRVGQDRILNFLQEERRRLKQELKRELQQDLRRESRQAAYAGPFGWESRQEAYPSFAEGSVESPPGWTPEQAESLQESWVTPPAPRVGTGEVARVPSEDPGGTKAGFAVWHPHPDDDVNPGGAAGRARDKNAVPKKMFRKHYERYLENYEGYVKLAGSIYEMRDDGQVPPGSPAEHEWVERLRRVNDGIARTTARLDILEHSNPELATDECISQRARIARDHSDLVRKN